MTICDDMLVVGPWAVASSLEQENVVGQRFVGGEERQVRRRKGAQSRAREEAVALADVWLYAFTAGYG